MLPPRFVLLCWMPVLAAGCVSSASYSVSHGFVEAQEGPLGVSRVKTATPSPQTTVTLTHLGYGYSAEDPIRVGGGAEGAHQYLAMLRGPEGQPLRYTRKGSVGGFKSEGASLEGGLLELYEVTHDGLERPVVLFLDLRVREAPRAPDGFRLE